jgi:negative regulator of flagellin synthesis FlgM
MDISKINGIDKVLNTTKAKPAGKAEEVRQSDKVSLSAEAKQMAELQRAVDIVKNAPDVRADKVAEMKKFIANGGYSNSEVINKVADKLLETLGG